MVKPKKPQPANIMTAKRRLFQLIRCMIPMVSNMPRARENAHGPRYVGRTNIRAAVLSSWLFRNAAISKRHHRRRQYVWSQRTSKVLDLFRNAPRLTMHSAFLRGVCLSTHNASKKTDRGGLQKQRVSSAVSEAAAVDQSDSEVPWSPPTMAGLAPPGKRPLIKSTMAKNPANVPQTIAASPFSIASTKRSFFHADPCQLCDQNWQIS
mmetsp:Transcript_65476/g.153194  ORF Transcript_65476/g.153194 Transcript_65476/m.153194 type:complete len:208 (-) Transcript_65476:305-928(-)